MNSGITIETRGENAQKYDFERFFDASKALSILVSLHNDSILDLTPRAIPTPRVVSRGLRRMNSDPLRISNLFNFDDLPTSMEEEDELVRARMRNAGLGGGSLQPDGDDRTGLAPRPDGDGLTDLDAHPVPFARATTYDFSSANRFDGDAYNDRTSTVTTNVQQARRRSDIRKVNGVDVSIEWVQVSSDITEYKEQVIKDRELQCSLNQFIETFVQSKESIAEFMEQNGELDVNVSEWEVDPDGSAMKRSIEYTHPVDVPMAPPTARARKEQTYRRYGDRGLILETKTFVSDVPMTDCFYVADVMRVEARDDGKTMSLDIHFDIRFVKSTMFRSLIARTTKSEFEKFFHTLANFVATKLGNDATDAALLPSATPAPVQAHAKPPSVVPSSPWSQLPTILIALVFVMQIWILMDVRSVKSELRQMAAEIEANRVPVCEAVSVVPSQADQFSA
jgi:hypothetical protein